MLWQRDESTLVVTGPRAVLRDAVAGLVSGNHAQDRLVCTWDFMSLVHDAAGSCERPFRPVCVRGWLKLLRITQTQTQTAGQGLPVILFARWSARSVFENLKSPDVLVVLVDQRGA